MRMCPQVWNLNACNAIVGAFNLQGSAWDRTRRQYSIHAKDPPLLQTEIRVSDVPLFARQAQQPQRGGSSNGAAAEKEADGQPEGRGGEAAVPASWVAAVQGEERLHRLRADEGIPFRIASACACVCMLAFQKSGLLRPLPSAGATQDLLRSCCGLLLPHLFGHRKSSCGKP
jgi:hypothetical protein